MKGNKIWKKKKKKLISEKSVKRLCVLFIKRKFPFTRRLKRFHFFALHYLLKFAAVKCSALTFTMKIWLGNLYCSYYVVPKYTKDLIVLKLMKLSSISYKVFKYSGRRLMGSLIMGWIGKWDQIYLIWEIPNCHFLPNVCLVDSLIRINRLLESVSLCPKVIPLSSAHCTCHTD